MSQVETQPPFVYSVYWMILWVKHGEAPGTQVIFASSNTLFFITGPHPDFCLTTFEANLATRPDVMKAFLVKSSPLVVPATRFSRGNRQETHGSHGTNRGFPAIFHDLYNSCLPNSWADMREIRLTGEDDPINYRCMCMCIYIYIYSIYIYIHKS